MEARGKVRVRKENVKCKFRIIRRRKMTYLEDNGVVKYKWRRFGTLEHGNVTRYPEWLEKSIDKELKIYYKNRREKLIKENPLNESFLKILENGLSNLIPDNPKIYKTINFEERYG